MQTAALVTDIKDPFVKDIKEPAHGGDHAGPQPQGDRPRDAGAADQVCARSAGRRRTARGSTSTSATSRLTVKVPGQSTPILKPNIPVGTQRCNLAEEVGER
ncbi:hypothetical protein [Nocardioides convexus]|uniref:hypothetical protein n=1 Tax=Nocardioides convexus TaxID=2712224 RepID=UPI0024188E1D|nr:hypothetical protein [Nocardioides convexus]